MGRDGLTEATQAAILNANYLARRLAPHFPVLYTGQNDMVAHECILDLRPLTAATGVTVDDVAKRLIDYGFHAPTMSFPVAGTLMIEPTESESQAELDRFADAMIAIRGEIDQVADGTWSVEDSPLRHAPHTAEDVATDDWTRPYPRQLGAFPVPGQRADRYFPPVGRIDGAYGDRNVFCSCPPISRASGRQASRRPPSSSETGHENVRYPAAKMPDLLGWAWRGRGDQGRWTKGSLTTWAGTVEPRWSMARVSPIRVSGGTKARAMPWPSSGEKLPLVTTPTGWPSTTTA